MIVTELYNGQGLGNQLWCYFTTRLIAHRKGYDFGIMSSHKFKGKEFMNLDFGKQVIGGSGPEGGPPDTLPAGISNYYIEKMSRHPNSMDISKFDSDLVNIIDNTKIDGNRQSSEYIIQDKELIRSWLNLTKKLDNDIDYDNTCFIHIRGGDFLGCPMYLRGNYYQDAIQHMRDINPKIQFKIITDDIEHAKHICPDIDLIGGAMSNEQDKHKASHHAGGPIWLDWLLMYNAKNLIISASSFSFWATFLGCAENVIAPMYWAGYTYSDGYWSCGDSLIPDWKYLNRDGVLKSYDKCLKEKLSYENINKHYWT